MKKCTGFTLIEVMVALVIVAVALAAASRGMGVTVSNQAHLETRTLATWVAEDAIVEQQLIGMPQEEKQLKTVFGRTWELTFSTSPTFVPEVFKLSVSVRQQGDNHASANLATVIGPPKP